MSDFEISADLMAEYSPLHSLRQAAIGQQVARLAAETERWCWKAIAKGVGYRVWRSDPIAADWPSTVTSWQFAILAPDEAAPGRGTVYGPWSKASA